MTESSSPSGKTRSIAGVDPRSFMAILAADMPRSILIGISPLILSAYVVDRQFGEHRAAWLNSAELLAAALAAIAVAGWLTRGSRIRLAVLGVGLAVAAQLLSMFRLEFLPLFVLRAIAGAGAGLAGAASTASAAGTQNPERVFGAIGFAAALIGATTAGPIGWVIETYGAAGVFAVSAALTAIVSPLLARLPDLDAMETKPGIEVDPHASMPNLGTALVVLSALFLSMLGQNAVWNFTVQIGLTTGMTMADVSWVLALTALTALFGAALASWLNVRRGRTAPLLCSIGGTMTALILLVGSTDSTTYVFANGAWSFFFAFSMPFFSGALAHLDRRGRWATAGMGLAGIGASLGPAATGGLVEAYGYAVLGIIVVVSGGLAACLLAPVVWKMDRGQFDESPPPGSNGPSPESSATG